MPSSRVGLQRLHHVSGKDARRLADLPRAERAALQRLTDLADKLVRRVDHGSALATPCI